MDLEKSKICRACLTEDGEFQSLFIPQKARGQTIQLSEILCTFASIQITINDGLTELICEECASNALNMYLFKLQLEECDAILRRKETEIMKSPLKEIHRNQETLEETINQSNSDDIVLVKPEVFAESDDSQNQFNDNFLNNEYEAEYEETIETKHDLVEKDLGAKSADEKKIYHCNTCPRKFSREDLLLRHKIAHAIKINSDELNFDTSLEVEGQPAILIKAEDMLYSCDSCDIIFLTKHELADHKKNHRHKQHQCIICGKGYSKLSHLNRHMRTHSSSNTHNCPECNKSFSRPEQLTHHMTMHTGIKPHTCKICLKGFNQISNLKDHLRTHNGEKPFLCSTCGKGFNQLGNLRQHSVRHTGVKAHLCSTCGSGFASKGELSAHLRKHTGARPFVCPVCNHGFTTSSSLTKHKRIHSGEKPYECDTCKMKFSRSGILARHKRTHTGVKPYVCNYCAKAFTQSNDLTSHLRIHTGEKPYICDTCGQAFRQSSALKTHKKVHSVKLENTPTKIIQGFVNNRLVRDSSFELFKTGSDQ